ncbi:MAG: hypothetical protein AAB612_01360 [Patescibacteria group bacterium]
MSRPVKEHNQPRFSKTLVLLVLCILLGSLLRLVKFPTVPGGLNRDEAALGYNAFSLLKTGKDEWGKQWPIVFRSFGDYKLAGYIYTAIPSIAVFGLNAFSVRLPSLLAGIALIPLAYMFTLSFIPIHLSKKHIGVFAAGIQAIAPWALHYSKVAFEANLALMLFVLGLTYIIREAPQCTKKSFWGALLIFLSLITYNAPLVILPVIVLMMLLWKKKPIKSVILLALGIFVAFLLVFPATQSKRAITVFSDEGVKTSLMNGRFHAGSNILQRVYYSRPIYYSLVIGRQYISSFHPQFLVIRGGQNPWHQVPGAAHLSWTLYALAILGLVVGWKVFRREDNLLIYGIFFASPLASAITSDAPQATRMLLFFFMLTFFAAVGLFWISRYSKWIAMGVVIAATFELLFYMQIYLGSFAQHPQVEWLAGIDKAIVKANQLRTSNETIIIIGDQHYTYIYPLFYEKVNPIEFQSTVQYYPNDALGLSQVKQFGHYTFVSNGISAPAGSIGISQQTDGTITVK